VYNANSYVKVTWGTVKGADLYRVYRKTGTGDYEYIGSTSHTYFNDKEAGAGKTCRYIVKAKNEAGNSEASASVAIKHIDEPTLKSIENSAYGVLIKWDKVTGAEKYNVYRKVSGGEYKYIGATDKAYYTDKTAESGTKYYYAIRAKRDDSISSQSASLSKYYLEDTTLNTPTSTSKGIGLRWSEVTGAEGYMVYRKTADGSYKRITTEEGISNVTFRDTTAEKGEEYTYKIKAYKSKTYSAYSNTQTITDKY
jgi:fibronectin type 3 domain-containing protein